MTVFSLSFPSMPLDKNPSKDKPKEMLNLKFIVQFITGLKKKKTEDLYLIYPEIIPQTFSVYIYSFFLFEDLQNFSQLAKAGQSCRPSEGQRNFIS